MVAKYHSYGQDDVGPGVPGVEVGELARGHVQLVRDLHLQRPRAATITL